MLRYKLPLTIEQLEDILIQIRDEFITLHYEIDKLKNSSSNDEWKDSNYDTMIEVSEEWSSLNVE